MTLRTAIVIVLMLWAGHTARGQDDVVSRTPDRIERLRQWLDAVEQHEPGSADESLLRVASWDRTTLWRVWMDVGAIVSLIREPDILVFYTPIEPEPFSGIFRVPQPRLRMRVIPYSRDELKRLQLIAKESCRSWRRRSNSQARSRSPRRYRDARSCRTRRRIRRAVRVRRPSCCIWPTVSRPGSALQRPLGDGQTPSRQGVGGRARETAGRALARTKPFACGTWPRTSTCRRSNSWTPGTSIDRCSSFREIPRCCSSRPVRARCSADHRFRTCCCQRPCLATCSIWLALKARSCGGPSGCSASRSNGTRDGARRESGWAAFSDGADAIRTRSSELRRGDDGDEAIGCCCTTANMFLGAEADALGLTEEARQAYERASELYPLAQSPRLAISALAAVQAIALELWQQSIRY